MALQWDKRTNTLFWMGVSKLARAEPLFIGNLSFVRLALGELL
jgi:hypothetical protein